MSTMLPPLDKNPVLDPSQDFYQLRREGIGFIQHAGSDQWTDYNVHDPGITILEALCYAITDLGFRTGWRIEDLLMPEIPSADPSQPYPNQTFFTARDILTISPTTANDFRRVLIDQPGVKNAWLTCKSCACEVSYWAFCDLDNQLVLQYGEPSSPPNPAKEVWALGLYETLLELDDDPELGDLNDRMIVYNTVYHDSDGAHSIVMELRFPDIAMLDRDQWKLFLDSGSVFADSAQFKVELLHFGATKTDDVLTSKVDQNAYIRAHWNNVFYLSFRITLLGSNQTIDIQYATLRVFGDGAVQGQVNITDWQKLLTGTKSGDFIARYQRKAKATRDAVVGAKGALQAHRKLDEDYCYAASVGVEDVAVCADVELQPDADIQRVQGAIWFALEQYMNPPIPFRTLQELQAKGVPVEEIFNGPELDNGFIEDRDLDAAALKTMLSGSEIIDRLMDIDGVIAVNQLRMTKYDDEGNAVAGAADPAWVNSQPHYDPAKTSAAWLLAISPRHQPRLYLNQSRFLFYKSSLPFAARMDEALDALNQLRGAAERPKTPAVSNNLPVPPGVYRHPDDYFPVQYSFPLAYGIGPAGLPCNAPRLRVAQARDLKAYLMVFEQVLGNAFAQLAHTADLFSLDPRIVSTYFFKAFDETSIKGFNDIVADPLKPTSDAVGALVETLSEFQARRNAFLDHLLARFGEQFKEYALLLTNVLGEAVAQPRLIENKIAFLRRYPLVSHDRSKAFNYQTQPNAPDNVPGIKKRISLLLGYPDLTFVWNVGADTGTYPVGYSLVDGIGNPRLQGTVQVAAASVAMAIQAAWRLLLERMNLADAYATAANTGGGYTLSLKDAVSNVIGTDPQTFATEADALSMRDALVAWSANERLIVVEHLLLRPKFIGDALYPACCDNGCTTCGNEDPYSFRLTYVMPGWTEQYTDNLDLRSYAERTIQQETPSHLLPKICWVGDDGFVENPCDDVVDQLAFLLMDEGKTASNDAPAQDDACKCALAIYHAFSAVFSAWYADKTLVVPHKDVLTAQVNALMQTVPMFAGGTCTTQFDAALWDKVRGIMSAYFIDIALRGWQFERFEWAWQAWLDANATIDWTDERLIERVEAILAGDVQTSGTAAQQCDCARRIVTDCGAQFHKWMQDNLAAGKDAGSLGTFTVQNLVTCPHVNIASDTQSKIVALLNERYAAYAMPSYWLSVVVTLLANLRNTYPGATLHDCDQLSNLNPVRLDSTALGNYPRRTTL